MKKNAVPYPFLFRIRSIKRKSRKSQEENEAKWSCPGRAKCSASVCPSARRVVRQLSLVYGMTAEHCPCIEDPLELSRETARILLEKGDLERDDLVVLLSKNRPEIRRNNLCCIATLDKLRG